MTLAYAGALSLGPLCPIAVTGAAACAADLVTRLGLFTELSVNLQLVPPSFTAALSATVALIAQLTVSIALIPPFPGIDLQLAGNLTAIAELQAQLALITPLINLFDAAGIFIYAFDGATPTFGRSVTQALRSGFPGAGGASAHANALILATVSPATWESLLAFFEGAPRPPAHAGLVFGGATSIVSLMPIIKRALFGVYLNIKVRLAALLSLVARFTLSPPTASFGLDVLLKLKGSLQAAVQKGEPSAGFFFDAMVRLMGTLNDAAALIVKLQGLFGIAGIFVYKFDGKTSELGPALSTSLANGWPDGSPPTLNANALLLGTVTPSTWDAMQAFFGGA